METILHVVLVVDFFNNLSYFAGDLGLQTFLAVASNTLYNHLFPVQTATRWYQNVIANV